MCIRDSPIAEHLRRTRDSSRCFEAITGQWGDFSNAQGIPIFHQCIEDIEKTVLSSGLTMRDIGVDVEKYSLASQSYTIELKLRI